MTNEELQDAIVMTHAAFRASTPNTAVATRFEQHLFALIEIQRARAKEKPEPIAPCSPSFLTPPWVVT